MNTLDEARIVANRLWDKDKLAWLGILAKAKHYHLSLLEYVQRRIKQERDRRAT